MQVLDRKMTNDSFFQYESNICQILNQSRNQFDICIRIESFKVIGNKMNKYVSYSIEGSDRNG